MLIDNNTNARRHTLELVRWSAVRTMEQFMADQGNTVLITGCLVGDQITIWDRKQPSVWHSDQPDLLANAVGDKSGLVDPDVAWAPTVMALTGDATRLVVVVPDFAGHWSAPKSFDVMTVETTGHLIAFTPEVDCDPSLWCDLQRFVALEIGFAAQRGEAISIIPIDWRGNLPEVMVWAEPGDDAALGHGFHIVDHTTGFDDEDDDDEPIAPYRRSSLPSVAQATCAVVASWDVSPLNVRLTYTQLHRGRSILPRLIIRNPMPNISNRLIAVEEAFESFAISDFDAHARELHGLITKEKIDQADILRLVPEWIAAVERDIVREAIWLRRHVAAGTVPAIHWELCVMAALVAIPPDIDVPEAIRSEVVRLYDYATITPWERPKPQEHIQPWLNAAFTSAALGTNHGDDLRIRMHDGQFEDLTADDPRETGDCPENPTWSLYGYLAEPLVAALTVGSTTNTPARQTTRFTDEQMKAVMKHIV